MAKAIKQFDKSKGILVIIIAMLTLALLALVATYPKNQVAVPTVASKQMGKNVNLGAIQYDFSSGRAVKVSDEKLTKLESFLNESVKKNKELSSDCTAYYNAVMANEDRTQVLLRYGCPYPNANMFVVYQNDQWKILSPTNNFSELPVPLCSHVNDNNIAISIAPVCFNESSEIGKAPTYTIRS